MPVGKKEIKALSMSLSQLFVTVWLFLAAKANFAVSAKTYNARELESVSFLSVPIPTDLDVMTDIDLTGVVDENGMATIIMETAPKNILFVLARRTASTNYIPVSRSYDGNDWEAPPGIHSGLSIVCGKDVSSGLRKCQVTIPVASNDVYFITKYANEISDKAKVARFLERATFGPTLPEINAFDETNLEQSMAEYVRDQIATPVGSHREFYRQRLNPRRLETERHGVTGPKPCDPFSRWRNFAFTSNDAAMSEKGGFKMNVSTVKNGQITAYVISFAGFPRTVLYQALRYRQGNNRRILPDGSYKIVFAEDKDRPALQIMVNGVRRFIVGGNPTVNLDSRFVNANKYHELNLSNKSVRYISKGTWLLQDKVNSFTCNQIADPLDATHKTFRRNRDHYLLNSWRNPTKTVFGKHPNGSYMLYDQRLVLDENTVENPLIDGGGNKFVRSSFVIDDSEDPRPSYACANAPQNIFNEGGCKLSFDPNACVTHFGQQVAKAITLDDNTLSKMFSLTGRYVYSIQGALRFDESILPGSSNDPTVRVDLPCDTWKRSRWLRLEKNADGDWVRLDGTAGACTNSLTSNTTNQFASAIYLSTDPNPHMKDIFFRGECTESDRHKHSMVTYVTGENQCYQNVHPDYMSVYDMSLWARGGEDSTLFHHPGGPFKIRQFRNTGILLYPSSHEMSRWQKYSVMKDRFGEYVGRHGDSIEFEDLPAQLQTEAIADSLGSKIVENIFGNKGVLVCGSFGEVAPNPRQDDFFEIGSDDTDLLYDEKTNGAAHLQQKQNVWIHQALFSKDPLRQKMAWALSQILVVSPDGVNDFRFNEGFLVFYDIFVRNGLGNYRNILREVSFSIKMGQMLSFVGNRALGYSWHARNNIQYPDENYAREIMQLFTIGLEKLKMDGTVLLDDNGYPIETYDSKDIESMARAWTGFTPQPYRGNVEDRSAPSSNVDPMHISDIRFRDLFPKRGLDGKYVGDRYPLCEDIPEKSFLRRGAKYKLLGSNPEPKWQKHYGIDLNSPSAKHFALDIASGLYEKLKCHEADGECVYEPVIVLDEHLNCFGNECNVDTVRTVQLPGPIFYEYIRMPCVTLSFYENAKKLSAGSQDDVNMCGNPKLTSATEACCGMGLATIQAVQERPRHADRPCEYLGEKVTYATNAKRCYSLGGYPCDFEGFSQPAMGNKVNNDCILNTFGNNGKSIWNNVWSWTNATCSLQVAVQNNGLVALHHNPDKSGHKNPPPTAAHVNVDQSLNYFSIHWERNTVNDEQFPSTRNGCGKGACQIYNAEVCLCDTTVIETIAFSSLPSRDQVLSRLSIGAIEPALLNEFNSNQYQLVQSANGVEAWSQSNHPNYSTNTIFKVLDEKNDYVYLRNIVSTVQIGNDQLPGSIVYNIRNPPSFHDLSEHALRDAYFETDAVIDHLLYHENTPPFISKILIQQFGISNPSPRYIEAVARAFQSGSYYSSGISYGNGRWGDLASTAAAILLDREATAAVLDADPLHGSLKAPFNKVIGLMRSMEYKRSNDSKLRYPFFGIGTRDKIGQMPYEALDVFSFFSPLHQPSGSFTEANLVAPESQVLSMVTILGIMNGLTVFVKDGMVPCNGGFGSSSIGQQCNNPMGTLGYKPSSNENSRVIDELDLLLTSGRLSSENRGLILRRYEETLASDPQNALKVAQQLLIATPEFHSTNRIRKRGGLRKVSVASGSNSKPYKAIVTLFLSGGMDSFYMLAPFKFCKIYEEYAQVRGEARLEEDNMLGINANGSGQVCKKFGLNARLPAMKALYDDGMGLFLANTGHLDKPVTKYNYATETRAQLFAHNKMQKEAGYVDAFREKVGTGVLGRMLDILQGEGYGFSVSAISIGTQAEILDGASELAVDVVDNSGIGVFYDQSGSPSSSLSSRSMKIDFKTMNGQVFSNSGKYADLWSKHYVSGVDKSASLNTILKKVTLDYESLFAGGPLGNSLKTVSKLIRAREDRGVNRDAFYISFNGFDHHQAMKQRIEAKFQDINNGLEAFRKEITAAGLMDQVTLVMTSEFARTLSPNSGQGTDHAWGGNYFMMGGQLKGGRIVGEYPKGFTDKETTILGRGRLIPTTPWESVWTGVAQWFGIESENDLDYVLPNRGNFGCRLLSDVDLYKSGTNGIAGCGGDVISFTQSLLMSEARYLIGEEQKAFCKLLIDIALTEVPGTTFRCVVLDQMIKETDNGDDVDASCTHELNIVTEMSTDATGISDAVSSKINSSKDNIVETVTDGKIVHALCGLGDSNINTLVPTTSPAPTISSSRSFQPSERNGGGSSGLQAPVGFVTSSGTFMSPTSFFWMALLFLFYLFYLS